MALASRKKQCSPHKDEQKQGQHENRMQGRSSSNTGVVSHDSTEESVVVGRTTSASLSRNASGNLRDLQFERLLDKEVVDLDQLRKLSWGGIPTKHRPTVWRLLLV